MNVIRFLKLIYAIPSAKLQNIFRSRFQLDNYIMQTQTVAKIHSKTFSEYKNKYNGKELAIFATGPSLNRYKTIPNTINIGVNKVFLNNNLHLDYYFAQDYSATKDYIEEINQEKYSHITKFYGELPENYYGLKELLLKTSVIPESIVIRHNAKKYFTYASAHDIF